MTPSRQVRICGTATVCAAWLLFATGNARAEATPPSRAEPSDLERCVAAAVANPDQRPGAGNFSRMQTAFMLTGDSRVFAERYDQHECVGFLAAGARHVQSLELTLRSHDGRELAKSGTPSALAYIEHCGLKGEIVYPTLRVLDGQGEAVYAVLATDDPRPPVVRALERCPALGTPRPAPLDVGPVPRGQSIEQQLETARSELGALGYGPGRLVAYGALRAGEHSAKGTVLAQGRCYALVAVGSQQILDLDLRVFGPTLPLTAAGTDVTRARAARVKLCAQPPARYVLDVSAFQGEGAYAVAALELSEPDAVAGISGASRIDYAELQARMRAHGFDGEVLTSGIVERDEQLSVPLTLRPGACYAIGALDSSDQPAGGLQLGLQAPDGALLALDSTTSKAPLLFHCAKTSEQVQAVVSAAPGRRQARFALLLGRDLEAAAP